MIRSKGPFGGGAEGAKAELTGESYCEGPSASTEKAALSYAGKKIPVFPCSMQDKRPLTGHGFRDATTDRKIVRGWWSRWPDALIGVPTGPASGIFVLDVDRGHDNGADGFETLATLEAANAPLPETKRTRTPSGGLHYLFRYPAGVKLGNTAGKLGPGLDTRGEGGYAIFPPGKTVKGEYAFENPQTPLADVPNWFLSLLTPAPKAAREALPQPPQTGEMPAYVRAAIDGEVEQLATSPPGTRNDVLNRAAFSLGGWVAGGFLPESEAETLLYDAATTCGLVGDDGESSVLKTIRSGVSKGKDNPRSVPASPSTDTTPSDEPGPEESRIVFPSSLPGAGPGLSMPPGGF
jgi:hypothetical protein